MHSRTRHRHHRSRSQRSDRDYEKRKHRKNSSPSSIDSRSSSLRSRYDRRNQRSYSGGSRFSFISSGRSVRSSNTESSYDSRREKILYMKRKLREYEKRRIETSLDRDRRRRDDFARIPRETTDRSRSGTPSNKTRSKNQHEISDALYTRGTSH